MVRDDAEGDILFRILLVAAVRERSDLLHHRPVRIDIKEGGHVLTDDRKPLQSHARIDVFMLKLGIDAVSVIIKLRKDDVPDLHKAVSLASHDILRSRAVFFPAVIVDLRAGAAGARSMLPEIILFSEAVDALRGDADLLLPDPEGLVVIQIDGGIEPVRRYPHPLRQKLPGPVNRFLLKVISKGEIAQHLKEGAVPRGFPDILDIPCADAFLTGSDPLPGRDLLPREVGLQGGHAGIDQKEALIIVGDQRKALHPEVLLLLKKFKKHPPQLIDAVFLHFPIFLSIDIPWGLYFSGRSCASPSLKACPKSHSSAPA